MPTPPVISSRHTARRRHGGFTLLELVLVMLLLCIMAAMAAPMFGGATSGRQAQNAADQFVAVAQYARGEAVSRGRVVRLNIDLANGGTYYLTVQKGATFEKLNEEFGREFGFPEGMSVDCDAPQQPDGRYIEFQPTGRCDPANLRITAANGEVTTVGCLSATEFFQVLPPDQAVAWGAWANQKAQTQAQAGGGQ